jgi:hypothetical protein
MSPYGLQPIEWHSHAPLPLMLRKLARPGAIPQHEQHQEREQHQLEDEREQKE